MKTYTKFLIFNFIKSFVFVTLVLLGLIIILNVLGELEFFKKLNVSNIFPIYLALLNAPSFIFEMFLLYLFFLLNYFLLTYLRIIKFKYLNTLV